MRMMKKAMTCVVSAEEWEKNPDSGISKMLGKKERKRPNPRTLPESGDIRICVCCGRHLPLSDFPVVTSTLGHRKVCKECATAKEISARS